VTGWTQMTLAFESRGLPVPPAPPVLRPALRSCGDWCWATRPTEDHDLYLFRPLPTEELFTGPVDDYLAASQSGPGTRSYTISYDLVYRDLAIFIQVGWGGRYADSAAAASRLGSVFTRCQRLIDIADRRPPRPDSGWRLVCLDSVVRQYSACGWIQVPQPRLAPEDRFPRECGVDQGTALCVAERLYADGDPG
jgi:hypothetical protein